MGKPATRKLAIWIIKRLRTAGFEALLAGGCVRDMLLGRRPADYDVATSATPDEVKRLFGHVLMVGARFGVAIVVRGGRAVEVATFRSDVSYSDGRRPDRVVFSSDREDAMRRDFTINGMFYDPVTDQVIDYVGGRRDLDKQIVRAIGDPAERFGEDHLRMLRAVRFAARLDFKLDDATARAIGRGAANLVSISGERIRDELEKIFRAPGACKAIEVAGELELTEPIFAPALSSQSQWAAAVARLAGVADQFEPTLSMAALLAEATGVQIRQLTRRWGTSNEVRATIGWLAGNLGAFATAAEMPLADFKRLMAHPAWPWLRKLWRAQERFETGRDSASRRASVRAGKIDSARVAPDPLLTGADLLKMGLDQGPGLGRILREVYELQLSEKIDSARQARAEARRRIDEAQNARRKKKT